MNISPVYIHAETWIIRTITALAVALFGNATITSSVSARIAGIASAGFAFAVNEIIHYLKTNKQVATAETKVVTTLANDPELSTALQQLATSVQTLQQRMGNVGSVTK